ncbi:unnamed protein product [Closterium sp. NIES-54]
MDGPEERGGRGAGGSGEAQAQGQPRDSAMAPMQPSLGPPRDEPRVFGLDKFNGDNFAEWSFKMENIFDHYDLLEVMEGTEKRPENDPEKSPWVRKSAQGYLLLGQALGSSQIRHIKPFQREPEKGPKAWAALKGVHAPATAVVAVVLERQMAALRIEEDEAVEEGVQKFFDLLTRLEGADLSYSELQKKTKLLALLPESWSSLIINLNRDLHRLSLEDVKRAILQEDFRRRELASADGAGAASIGRGYGRGRGRGRGGGRFGGSNFNGDRGSSGYGNDNKNNGRGLGRFDGECHFCHKSGHMWRNCYKLPDGWTPAQGQEGRGEGGGRGRGRGGRGGHGGGAASMKSAGNESESRDDRFPGQFFFVSTQAPAGPENDEGFEEPAAVGKVTLHSLDYWVIDSGATYSMTPRADLLTELEPSPVKHVTSALGQRAEVKGMGKAMFKGADGKMVGLKNKNGIRHSLTMPYSPAMNGIAERANWTITETARGLLIEAGLPDYFWPDAVRSACVAKNRALTHVGADKWVPYVEWIGRKPKVDMLRVFGCMCMALVPKHLQHNKLGAKAIWAVHLGMAQNSNGWLLWDPFTKKFLVSRDSKFMENLMYKDWKAENEAKIGMRFGEVKSSGLEHVELPLELSSSSTTTRQSSLVNGGDEAKDVEEEEEEVQQVSERTPTLPSRTTSAPRIRVTPQQRQGLHVPAAEEEGRGKRRIQAPNRLTYDSLGKPAKSALAGAALMVGEDEESDYEDDAEDWKKAMESELKSIEENGTWELVELPKGRKAITSKWLFKFKSDADGKIVRYKSRLVAKGYQQKEKVDYKELFAPVVKPTTLRTLLAGAAIKGWVVMLKLQDKFKCKALGVVNFYLRLHIERDVEKRCMRVHQRKYLEALAAYFGQSEGHVATPFPSRFKCVKGPEEESVGEEERHRFHSLVGSLMYAAVNMRPDVAFATGQFARVVQCPNEEQEAARMRVAKYLGQTPIVGLQYSAAAQMRQKGADGVETGRLFLTAFSDASYASELEDMTSVGGFICCVGGGPTAWESKKQVDQALSSVESEYMALFRAIREIVWQRHLLAELGEEQQGPTPLYCDSHGAIALAKNPVLHGLTKHMRVKWHWTRSMVAAGEVELHYVKTTGQPADMMTKKLVEQQHWNCCKLAGMALN